MASIEEPITLDAKSGEAAYDLTLWSIFRHVCLHEETR